MKGIKVIMKRGSVDFLKKVLSCGIALSMVFSGTTVSAFADEVVIEDITVSDEAVYDDVVTEDVVAEERTAAEDSATQETVLEDSAVHETVIEDSAVQETVLKDAAGEVELVGDSSQKIVNPETNYYLSVDDLKSISAKFYDEDGHRFNDTYSMDGEAGHISREVIFGRDGSSASCDVH